MGPAHTTFWYKEYYIEKFNDGWYVTLNSLCKSIPINHEWQKGRLRRHPELNWGKNSWYGTYLSVDCIDAWLSVALERPSAKSKARIEQLKGNLQREIQAAISAHVLESEPARVETKEPVPVVKPPLEGPPKPEEPTVKTPVAVEDAPIEGPVVDIVRFDFHGDELTVIPRDDKLFVVLKRACEILGIDHDVQRKKLKQAKWATTVMMTAVANDGKTRPMFCLELNSLPMWLATIDESRVRPELQDKLALYQVECADALRDRFFGKPKQELANKELVAGVFEMVTKMCRTVTALSLPISDMRAELSQVRTELQALHTGVSTMDGRLLEHNKAFTHISAQIYDMTGVAVETFKVATETHKVAIALSETSNGIITKKERADISAFVEKLCYAYVAASISLSVNSARGTIYAEMSRHCEFSDSFDELPSALYPRAMAFLRSEQKRADAIIVNKHQLERVTLPKPEKA